MTDLKRRAAAIAKVYFEDAVDVHSEVEHLIAEDMCYVANSSPAKNDALLRDRQLANFRILLSTLDVEELAYAEFPQTGQEEGYTYVMLIGPADEAKTEAIRDAYYQAIRETE